MATMTKVLRVGASFIRASKKAQAKKFEQIFDPTFLEGGEAHLGAKKNGWLKDWKEKKVFKFTWDYCGQCDTMFVRCPCCGNNCCNAGFGDVTTDLKPARYGDKGSKTCPICNLCYDYQHLAWKTKTAPVATEAQRKKGMRDAERGMKKLFG